VHNDPNHQALAGNGPGGGAPGDINSPYAVGGAFATDRYLVHQVGGSGGGGTNDNGQVGSPGGSGGGALMIASSTKITLNGPGGTVNGLVNGVIYAGGGSGGGRGCGGSGGAVRLVTNTVAFSNNYGINVGAGGGGPCKTSPQPGLTRIEANNEVNSSGNNFGNNGNGPYLTSLPFQLNLPTVPPPVIMVSSINGVSVNANPFSFPDATINSAQPVPVVISATNMPAGATVTLFLLSDSAPNQSIPVTMVGTTQASSATVQVTFPAGATRGFVKSNWSQLGQAPVKK
jgi:hypothetical protein